MADIAGDKKPILPAQARGTFGQTINADHQGSKFKRPVEEKIIQKETREERSTKRTFLDASEVIHYQINGREVSQEEYFS